MIDGSYLAVEAAALILAVAAVLAALSASVLKRLSQQLGGFAVAAVLEEASSVAPRHRVEGPAHRLYERLVGACPAPRSDALSLAKASSMGLRSGE